MTRPPAKKPAEQNTLPSNGSVDITPQLIGSEETSSPERDTPIPPVVHPSIPEVMGSSLQNLSVSFDHSRRSSPTFSPLLRFFTGATGLFLIAGFLLAMSLEPASRGYGTHQQLGLPPCSIQLLFGIPCPSCGMTTSFACYVRGQMIPAWQANPAGLLLAIVCTLLIPWTLISCLINRPWGVRRLEIWATLLLSLLVLAACLQWGVRLWQQA